MKLSRQDIQRLILEENEKLQKSRRLTEDFGRGLPDFVVSDVAKNCAEDMRRHILRHINQTAQNPRHKRELLAGASTFLKELEVDIKDKLTEKLESFVKNS